MLRVSELTVRYGPNPAVQGVNITVDNGELVVLLGANGAGKSTIFRTLSGLTRPTAGRIELFGKDVTGLAAHRAVREGIAHCPEGRMLFPQLSVQKNLLLGAYTERRDKRAMQARLEQVFELFPVLRDKQHAPAGSLSGGQQQMVAIGRALMANPRLLLLDEPSLGLAPLVVEQVLEAIRRIHETGVMVLLAEQNARAALEIADRGYVIENGRVVMEGTRDELLRSPRVQEAYLGV
ncbi:MAG: ABC transporter ATP-binding protein [Thermoflavifilum sp.]|nr:ABC transporter ATP-binding protein [Thermoflavifilum sp.]MCL6513591.1 ABC transporter ATP-binding protein [Alicyclobacillus sp.]